MISDSRCEEWAMLLQLLNRMLPQMPLPSALAKAPGSPSQAVIFLCQILQANLEQLIRLDQRVGQLEQQIAQIKSDHLPPA